MIISQKFPCILSMCLVSYMGIAGNNFPTIVNLDQGPVQGKMEDGVRKFLDIKTHNASRWQYAQPLIYSPIAQDATVEKPACYQNSMRLIPYPNAPLAVTNFGSVEEDCLDVTVITPESPNLSIAHPLPVIVYIHGGGGFAGSNSENFYSMTNHVKETNSIAVVIKYRLGVFANFPLFGALPANLGIEDAKAQLKWVHNNINKFGGDPDKITLWGQSAGGGLITRLMLNNNSVSIPDSIASLGVNNVIVDSPAPINGIPITNQIGASIAVAQTLGCVQDPQNPDVPAAIACVLSKQPNDVLNAANSNPLLAGAFTFSYGPGTQFADKPLKLFKSGQNIQDLNTIIGYNGNEGTGLAWILGGASFPPFNPTDPVFQTTSAIFAAPPPQGFGISYANATLTDVTPEAFAVLMGIAHASEIGDPSQAIAYYAQKAAVENTTLWKQVANSIGDRSFVCPVDIISNSLAEQNQDVWRYVFTHQPYDPVYHFNAGDGDTHSVDLPYQAKLAEFGDFPALNGFSSNELLFSDDLLGYHYLFMRAGRPTSILPLTDAWRKYRITPNLPALNQQILKWEPRYGQPRSQFHIARTEGSCGFWNQYLIDAVPSSKQ
ncbi:carboxylesterase family protein [Legionella waltersii]|uniref:Carboxylic ester hydrolase n=1 Tax=Legionella waltersii TaxID=66969 RepID=A0A0W1AKA7_9GAMM|nr:carboxylesterase family protein [Legionella waltersii]KTD81730.1 Para-nitrobenzyl esterase [Legionella waltersii]SNV11466.1 Para-nitrobenzyl esterase [Legionella waltersii]